MFNASPTLKQKREVNMKCHTYQIPKFHSSVALTQLQFTGITESINCNANGSVAPPGPIFQFISLLFHHIRDSYAFQYSFCILLWMAAKFYIGSGSRWWKKKKKKKKQNKTKHTFKACFFLMLCPNPWEKRIIKKQNREKKIIIHKRKPCRFTLGCYELYCCH